MNTIYDIYTEFGRCLLEDRLFEDPKAGYGDICAALGVGAEELDGVLLGELGMGGEQILSEFGNQICY